MSSLHAGHASMVLATFVCHSCAAALLQWSWQRPSYFSICADRLCKKCANTLLLTRACLRERAFCTRDARRSNKRSYQHNCLRDAGLFLLQHSANYHTHPTYADLNTTFSGHFHRSASVFRLHFGISVFIESVSELGPTPEPIVSASSSGHPQVAHFPACADWMTDVRKPDTYRSRSNQPCSRMTQAALSLNKHI